MSTLPKIPRDFVSETKKFLLAGFLLTIQKQFKRPHMVAIIVICVQFFLCNDLPLDRKMKQGAKPWFRHVTDSQMEVLDIYFDPYSALYIIDC